MAESKPGWRTVKPKRWNCHEHRDELQVSDNCTVYHPERGQLCYIERHWDCYLFLPIRFVDKSAAQKWITSGTIADLQESLGNLGVGFETVCYQARS